ncbi:MAG: acetyl/propionyl/methylcrotonyl-CoA carboxylase subunit alpha, partial [Gammaproteobacteria bacterium]
ANRGEIACRVMRTCRRLGVATGAVYSDADRHALHAGMADEAVYIGPAQAADSYLNMDHILEAAKRTGAEGIHPGYGFLSENSEFARRCRQAGVVFIGPSPESMDAMASKSAAVTLMEKAGVPVTPGYHGADQNPKKLAAEAARVGFPILIKPSAGGGGKGMHIVNAAGGFAEALQTAKREAENAFGDDHVLLEKYVQQPRHIEFQVFGDTHGNVVHLFERECSLQRRFQKVVEESPSPFLDAAMRREMGAAAVAAAKAVNYFNAGTIEFIVGADRKFHFMEMNTRLQVEHPITEETTGVDLVEWQLRIACGEKLPLAQDEIRQHGHAIEARLYAENADKGFLPVTGRIGKFVVPTDEFTRVDTGVRSGDSIGVFYDPLIAKISVRGADRAETIRHMQVALAHTAVFGMITNLPLLRGIVRHPLFAQGTYDTGFIPRELAALLERPAPTASAVGAAIGCRFASQAADARDPWRGDGWRADGTRGTRLVLRAQTGGENQALRVLSADAAHAEFEWQSGTHTWRAGAGDAGVQRDGDEYQVANGGVAYRFVLTSAFAPRAAAVADTATRPGSPMPGRVVAVHVKEGDAVEVGQALLVLEGMKMEFTVKAAVAGHVAKLFCKAGDTVEAEVPLVNIQTDAA